MTRILVTGPEYDKADKTFVAAAREGFECIRAAEEEAALAEAIRQTGAGHVIVGIQRYTGPLYDALPSGGVIARFGVGHDSIDKHCATSRGLLCTNTPGVLVDAVAELAIGLILAAARQVPAQVRATNRGSWSPAIGSELRGKVLAVIGCGPIGCRLAYIASRGFGMEVVGCDIADVNATQLQRDFGFLDVHSEFADAARAADFVSLHIPSTPTTRHFVGAERLSALSAKAWLINTARGAVVEEDALFDALSTGALAGAALDVFEREPYVPATPDKDLRTLDNVIMTPHIGSSTREACQRMAARALRNVKLAEARRFDEMDLLNREVCPQLEWR